MTVAFVTLAIVHAWMARTAPPDSVRAHLRRALDLAAFVLVAGTAALVVMDWLRL